MILMFMSLNINSMMNSPTEFEKSNISNYEQKSNSYLLVSLISLVKFYQTFISPIKQENCRMYPSCSNYSLKAIKKYGFIGILMTTDRLHRCGHDLQLYQTILTKDSIRYLDMVK
jgi:putative membrane protein insertion efficiency factor